MKSSFGFKIDQLQLFFLLLFSSIIIYYHYGDEDGTMLADVVL